MPNGILSKLNAFRSSSFYLCPRLEKKSRTGAQRPVFKWPRLLAQNQDDKNTTPV